MYGRGPDFDILFHRHDGMSARRMQVERSGSEVDALSENAIHSQSDDKIIAIIQEKLIVKVPTLKRDDISFEREMRTVDRQDMWGDSAEVVVPVFYFDVPYEGEDLIFTMQPNAYSSNPPRGQARNGVLRISVQGEEDATKLQQEVNATLDRVEEYLSWHRQMWNGLDDEIANAARGRLSQRRQKLSSLGQAEAGLAGLGFKPKGG